MECKSGVNTNVTDSKLPDPQEYGLSFLANKILRHGYLGKTISKSPLQLVVAIWPSYSHWDMGRNYKHNSP